MPSTFHHTGASILAVGDELTLGQSLDTNSRWLSHQLFLAGIPVYEHATVADDRAQIARAITRLSDTSPLLLVTGGLGPTQDDLTRHALADALGESLLEDEEALGWIKSWFASTDRDMPESNIVQALRPPSARMIRNDQGTAPGLVTTLGACDIWCFPGPPAELHPMFEHELLAALRPAPGAPRASILKCVGQAEAVVATRLSDLMQRDRGVLVGTTASQGIITIRLRAQGKSARDDIERVANTIKQRLGSSVYADTDISLPDYTLRLLRERGESLATAESCTAGMLGAAMTDIPGSSDVYLGGWITYIDDMKTQQLGVPAHILEKHGAVSAQTTGHMATAAHEQSGATHALAISGIAGPGGGTPDKPVGTVWIAHATEYAQNVQARLFRFTGSRSQVRTRAVTTALAMLRQDILGITDSTLLWQRD